MLRKSLLLYNGFQVGGVVVDVIVVEGFPSVWWLWQRGFVNAVALMGSICSDEQADLIVRTVAPLGRVWLLPDGDEAGERYADSVLTKVVPHRFVRRPRWRTGSSRPTVTPTSCSTPARKKTARRTGLPSQRLAA